MARLLILPLLGALACAGTSSDGKGRALPGPDPEAEAPRSQVTAPAKVPSSRGPTVSEAQARFILARGFRRAGLRILSDVEVVVNGVSIAADGYDPKRAIGFEYTAPEERVLQSAFGDKLEPREDQPRLLFLLPCDEETLRTRMKEFLDRHAPAAPN